MPPDLRNSQIDQVLIYNCPILPNINQNDALVATPGSCIFQRLEVIRMLRSILFLAFAVILAACVSDNKGGNVLQSAVLAEPAPVEAPAQAQGENSGQAASAFAFEQQAIAPTFVPNPKETYLINGLASSVEFHRLRIYKPFQKNPGLHIAQLRLVYREFHTDPLGSHT